VTPGVQAVVPFRPYGTVFEMKHVFCADWGPLTSALSPSASLLRSCSPPLISPRRNFFFSFLENACSDTVSGLGGNQSSVSLRPSCLTRRRKAEGNQSRGFFFPSFSLFPQELLQSLVDPFPPSHLALNPCRRGMATSLGLDYRNKARPVTVPSARHDGF